MQTALEQMLTQQVRAWDVLDPRVLELMSAVPREAFVPHEYRSVAYADTGFPLGHGQRMLAPKMIGRILQALAPQADDTVLEVGTGSGYLTACLARATRSVRSLEIYDDLAERARTNLAAVGTAADVVTADAFVADSGGRYSIVVVTGSLPQFESRFEQALAPGGRLFCVVGDGPAQSARLVRRLGGTASSSEDLFETWVEPLVHAGRVSRFVF
jgi:protein-L-isoaspartate(D-aspartate) O-methyltransferase